MDDDELKALGFFTWKIGESQKDLIDKIKSDRESPNNKSNNQPNVLDTALMTFLPRIKVLDPFVAEKLLTTYSSLLNPSSPVSQGDLTVKLSRALRLVWLDSLLVLSSGKLYGSFRSEIQNLLLHEPPLRIIDDVVVTAFDCLAVSLLRKDPPKYFSLWRAFITKQLPLIIKDLSLGNFSSQQMEFAICQSLIRLDRGTISLFRISGGGDALDEMFSSFPSTTSDIRHEFLRACVAASILPWEAIQRTLGEEAAGYSFENLKIYDDSAFITIKATFDQILDENTDYVPFADSIIVKTVASFEDYEAEYQYHVAKNIVDLIETWSSAQNTRSLRRLCIILALKTTTIDMLVLHVAPTIILKPLVRLLDKWKEDEDEVNFQDVYTDFGCILLLVVLVYERYHLSPVDLGLKDEESEEWKDSGDQNSSFCLSIIAMTGTSESLEDMSTTRKELLGGWISALFDTGGISDDLMKASSLKELFTLVPTIFQQAISACANGTIDIETLRGGMEYFLQPFLLATIIGVQKWMCNYLWRLDNTAVAIQVIQTIILGSGVSGDADNILQIVLTITADPLYNALAAVERAGLKTPGNPGEIAVDHKVISILQSHLSNPNPTRVNDLNDVHSIILAVKEHIGILASWMQSLDQGHVTGPPGYNVTLIPLAVDLLGARKVLSVMLEEIETAETQGTAQYTTDVTAVLVVMLEASPSDKLNSSLLQEVAEVSIGTTGGAERPAFIKLKIRVDELKTLVSRLDENKKKDGEKLSEKDIKEEEAEGEIKDQEADKTEDPDQDQSNLDAINVDKLNSDIDLSMFDGKLGSDLFDDAMDTALF